MTCYTALVTPFDKEGKLDEEGFIQNIEHQNNMDGLVVLGTTGEAPTLSIHEKKRLISLARTSSVPLMVGCGVYSTSQTKENLKIAADLGANCALVVTPYYNKPTQEGLFQHFKVLADHSPLPIVLYNIEGRTSVNLELETLKRLISIPKIIGIKEVSGCLRQISERVALKKERADFLIYAGDDIMTLPLMALGGDGVICVVSNLVPQLMRELVTACKKNDFPHARALHFRLLPLFKACSFQTNPIPIKAAMNLAGLAAGAPRLPLTPIDSSFLESIKNIVNILI